MKKLILIAILCASCCDNSNSQRKETRNDYVVTATIVGIDQGKTYVKDDHGHLDYIHGVWGKEGDSISLYCRNGYITRRL